MNRKRCIYLTGGLVLLVLCTFSYFYFSPCTVFADSPYQILSVVLYHDTVDLDCDPTCYVTYKKETSNHDEIKKTVDQLRSISYSRADFANTYPGAVMVRIELRHSEKADPETIILAGPEADFWTIVSFGEGQWYHLKPPENIPLWDMFHTLAVETNRTPVI